MPDRSQWSVAGALAPRLPGRGVEDRPEVDGPSEQKEPEHPGEDELEDGHEEAPLKELAKTGNEEAAQGGNDVSGGALP
jgi:hypothetical protein